MSEVESAEVESSQPESNDNVEGTEIESQEGETTKEQQVQSMIRKLKLKVDGEEIEEDYDLSNQDQLIRDLQLARAAKKRMAEAQEAKRKAFDIAQQFEKDPVSILERLGDKGYETAEKMLLKKIQQEMMTPEQRELAELKSRLERFEAQEKAAKEAEERQKQDEIEDRYRQQFQTTIIGALEKAGLPKTPRIAQRMAQLLQYNINLGYDLTPEELAHEAKKEFSELFGALSKDAEAEQLLNLIGKDAYKKLNKHQIDILKKKQFGKESPNKSLTQSSFKPKSSNKQKTMTWEDWNNEVSRRIKSQDQD
jgi:hypothetical protein